MRERVSRLKSERVENQQTLVINHLSAVIISKRDEGRGKTCFICPRENIRKER